jgi:hypothetical protein
MIKIRIKVKKLLVIILPRMEKLKLKCSNKNKTVLWKSRSIKEYMMNDLFPILFMQISSLTSKILCGIVILEIAGFKNAISTEAVE